MDLPNERGLPGLPVELLTRIARLISTQDLCHLRLSCKAVESALFLAFRDNFRKKQFMVSDFSLQALVGISKHAALSPVLEHVIFGLDNFHSASGEIFETPSQAVWFHRAAARQVTLWSTGRAMDLLVEAFSGLNNLRSVELRDFNSPRRYRDGPNATWRSYGAPTAQAETGVVITTGGMPHEISQYASSVFSLLLAALARADARPENIYGLLRTRPSGLMDSCFDLTPLAPAGRRRVLAGLRTLHVDIKLDQTVFVDNGRGSIYLAGLCFHPFLAELKNLCWLRINFQKARTFMWESFMDHASPDDASIAPKPLANLQKLELGNGWMSKDRLCRGLSQLPALRSLKLWNITLQELWHPDKPTTIWGSLFERLARETSLRAFFVGNAREAWGSDYAFLVRFAGDTFSEYDGDAMDDYLKTLVTVTKAHPNLHPLPGAEDDDGSDRDDGSVSDGSGSDGSASGIDGDEQEPESDSISVDEEAEPGEFA